MTGFWLTVGVVCILRKTLGLDVIDQHLGVNQINSVIAFVIANTLFNLIRWWYARPRPTIRTLVNQQRMNQKAGEKKPDGERPFEYHPEFDFFKPGP